MSGGSPAPPAEPQTFRQFLTNAVLATPGSALVREATKRMPALVIAICIEIRQVKDFSMPYSGAGGTAEAQEIDLAFSEFEVDSNEFQLVAHYCEMPYFQSSASDYVRTPHMLHALLTGLAKQGGKVPTGLNSFRSRNVSQWLNETFLGWHCAHTDDDGVSHTAVALAPKEQPLTGQKITEHIRTVGGIQLIQNAPAAVESLMKRLSAPPTDMIWDACNELWQSLKETSATRARRVHPMGAGDAETIAEHDEAADAVIADHDSWAKDPRFQQLHEAMKAHAAADPLEELHAYRLFMTLMFNGGKGTLVRGESPIVLINPVVVHVHGTYLASMATECAVKGWIEPSPSFMIIEQIVMQELMREYRGTLQLYGKAADPALQKHQRRPPHKDALWHRLKAEEAGKSGPKPPMCIRDILLVRRERMPLSFHKKDLETLLGEPGSAGTREATAMTMKPLRYGAPAPEGAAKGGWKAHEELHAMAKSDLEAFCKTRVKLAANSAAAFQAAAVIFVAQSDAGTKFRDREGRAAAQHALEAAVRAMLHDV